MQKITIAAVALSLLSGTLAAASACVPNDFELQNLEHHHDINTGDVVASGEVMRGRLKVAGGSGCSPLWAGGVFDDSALFDGGRHPEFLSNIIKRHEPSEEDLTSARRRRLQRRSQIPNLSRRHGPTNPKTPRPRVLDRRHGPGTPKTPAPRGSDRNVRLPRLRKRHEPEQDERRIAAIEKRHGPDDDDGHLTADEQVKTIERRNGADDDDGYVAIDETVAPENGGATGHGPDEDDGHFAYPQKRHDPDSDESRRATLGRRHDPDSEDSRRVALGRRHDPDSEDSRRVAGEKRHDPDSEDSRVAVVDKRHGPDGDDGHLVYPEHKSQV